MGKRPLDEAINELMELAADPGFNLIVDAVLREYFAGQALTGMAAGAGGLGQPWYLAQEVYKIADAMLVERKRLAAEAEKAK